jgi:hypothetical protein
MGETFENGATGMPELVIPGSLIGATGMLRPESIAVFVFKDIICSLASACSSGPPGLGLIPSFKQVMISPAFHFA